MKIAMIGGSGFVGTRLIDLLKEDSKNYECKNIDLLPSHFFNDITVIGDVREQAQMDRELKGADVIILLAAQHRDDVTPVSLYYDTNVGGMEVTLRAMEKNGCRRIIFFSSVAVYGLNKKNPDENHPKDPFNHYGKSKWQAEQVLENGMPHIQTGTSTSSVRQSSSENVTEEMSTTYSNRSRRASSSW